MTCHTSRGPMGDETKLPVVSARFGNGYRAAIAMPVGSSRDSGIRLPGNGSPVNGSMTAAPLALKSPVLSTASGTCATRVSALRSRVPSRLRK